MADEGYSAAYLPPEDEGPVTPGLGWILFAGLVLTIAGVVSVIYGIAAISNSDFYARGEDYIVGNLQTWGWIVLIIGIVKLGAGYGIWRGARWGIVLGLACASVNAIVQLLWLPAEPLGALAVYALDLLVIYGLLRHGRMPEAI